MATTNLLEITTLDQLAIATRTNEPFVQAPEEFQKEITKVAVKYINSYARRYTAKEVTGMMELLDIVKNRFENLTVKRIMDGTISKPADVMDLLKSNAMMEPEEERAIIEAYKHGVQGAEIYVYLFFSFKVYDYMRGSYLFNGIHEEDVYTELQSLLYKIVDDFDFTKKGGLVTKYYKQRMCDYYRNIILGKQQSMLTCGRRQITGIRKIQKNILAEHLKTMSCEELSEKYEISKYNIQLYLNTKNSFSLDAYRDDESNENYNHIVVDNKNIFEKVEIPIKYEQMFAMLQKDGIEKETVLAILQALLGYANKCLAESEKKIAESKNKNQKPKIKKATNAVYDEISEEVGVDRKVVDLVKITFAELFM